MDSWQEGRKCIKHCSFLYIVALKEEIGTGYMDTGRSTPHNSAWCIFNNDQTISFSFVYAALHPSHLFPQSHFMFSPQPIHLFCTDARVCCPVSLHLCCSLLSPSTFDVRTTAKARAYLLWGFRSPNQTRGWKQEHGMGQNDKKKEKKEKKIQSEKIMLQYFHLQTDSDVLGLQFLVSHNFKYKL